MIIPFPSLAVFSLRVVLRTFESVGIMVTGILLVLLYRTARALLKTQSTMERPGEQKRGEAAAGMANEFGVVRPVVAILVGVPGQGKKLFQTQRRFINFSLSDRTTRLVVGYS